MGVVSNDWFDCFALDRLHVQTLMLTDADVRTPFLGTPLVPLKYESGWEFGPSADGPLGRGRLASEGFPRLATVSSCLVSRSRSLTGARIRAERSRLSRSVVR